MSDIEPAPELVRFEASDGYAIGGSLWRHPEAPPSSRAVVIVNPATSVRARYYGRFAAFLFASGFDVLTYDYRGIGQSRPATLRGLDAGWLEWGCLDFEAALRYVKRSFPDQPVHVVAHSIGGVLIGVAPSNHRIQRIFTMGAQYAYWRDYATAQRLRMLAKWHVAMPLVTAAFGYFPGKRLGWLEDTPRGVVRDWAASRARFEEIGLGRAPSHAPGPGVLQQRFAAVPAPILAVSVTDDPFGTIAAIERPLAYFEQSPRTHLRIAPDAVGEKAIGHFGFFHSRFERTLWQIPLAWLKSGEIASAPTGVVISARASRL